MLYYIFSVYIVGVYTNSMHDVIQRICNLYVNLYINLVYII